MKDKKLRPVSEELVNKIINQDAVPSSYGCGCGSGCGCGDGSGSGSGDIDPDDPEYWRPEKTRLQTLNFNFEDNYITEGNYRFILKGSGSCTVCMYRENKGAEWRLKFQEISITLSVEGSTTEYQDPISGNIVFFETNGSKSVTVKHYDNNDTSAYASLKCSTVSPQKGNYIIEARASFSVVDVIDFYAVTNKSLTGSISSDF